MILVWNKIDLGEVSPGIDRDEHGKIQRVRLSARTGAGMEHLRTALAEMAAVKTPLNTQQRLTHVSGA
jgi:GTP-binding protein HflX